LRQFAPGVGRILEAVLFQQICSIIKEPCVSKKGNGDKLSFNSVILDDARKEFTTLAGSEILREINANNRIETAIKARPIPDFGPDFAGPSFMMCRLIIFRA
jgi:hypothetical protein